MKLCNQTVWYWHKGRYADQWNRIESPAIAHTFYYSHLIFANGAKTIQWKKEESFQRIALEQLATHMRKNEVGSPLQIL